MCQTSRTIQQQITCSLSKPFFKLRQKNFQPMFNQDFQSGSRSYRDISIPRQASFEDNFTKAHQPGMGRDGPLRSTQIAHQINTNQGSRPGSAYGSANTSPNVSPKNRIKRLFGRLRSHHDIRDTQPVQPEKIPINAINTTSPGMVRQNSNQFMVPPQKGLVRSISNSPTLQSSPFGTNIQQPEMRRTAAIFDRPLTSQNLAQQYIGQPVSYDLSRGRSQERQNPTQNRTANFNIFEHYANQSLQQPGAMNMQAGAKPQNNTFVAPSQPFGGNINQGGNIFAHYANQAQHQGPGMTGGPFAGGSGYNFNAQLPLEALGEHGRVHEFTEDANQSGRNVQPQDGFHGKSMRSIQLFNTPTAASPNKLHPSRNPMVKAESPNSRARRNLPAREKPSMLDIHADSCYNYLNKRRYRVSGQDQTPLEAFFLQESLNQFKVVNALQSRKGNLYPGNKPGPLRRTKKYLLVLDIDETLVHSEPIIVNGQQTGAANKQFDKTLRFNNPNGSYDVYGVKFRPFLHDFIHRMSKLYDLAVYTASAKDYADAIMDTIDPSRSIFCARLYREHCLPVAGMNLKNMENFDGKDVFIVDNLIYSFAFHMNQGIPICAFVDDPMDVELQDLAEILENLPFYESMPALIQDMLGLDEFYQDLSYRLRSQPSFV